MKRQDELEAKIDALIEEYSDLSYEDLSDTFDYYASQLQAKANRK